MRKKPQKEPDSKVDFTAIMNNFPFCCNVKKGRYELSYEYEHQSHF